MQGDFIKRVALRIAGRCRLELNAVAPAVEKTAVRQRAVEIPLIDSVDVVVVGGTTAAVAAALRCAEQGASVYLIAPRSYLGEELCGTLRICDPAVQAAGTHNEGVLPHARCQTPASLKAHLAGELAGARVKFVYLAYVSDLLVDSDENLRGVVFVSRGGRKAVAAGAVIDATCGGWTAAKSGAEFGIESDGGLDCEFNRLSSGWLKKIRFTQFRFSVGGSEGGFRDLDQIRQRACGLTLPGLMRADSLFYRPLRRFVCAASDRSVASLADVTVDHLRSKTYSNLFLLNGCADIPRALAAQLIASGAIIQLAARVAAELCQQSAAVNRQCEELRVKRAPLDESAVYAVAESFETPGGRGVVAGSVSAAETTLPVLYQADVVVVGGGTAGAAAAIAAARRGARTLVIEMHHGLGGIGTLGLIGKPFAGRKAGFAKEVPFPRGTEIKMEWYRQQLRKAGGEIWFQTTGCGAVMDGTQVRGVVVATPEGRGAVLAKVVVDATGSADIAIRAGADYSYADLETGDIAIQGTGVPHRAPRDYKNNSDYLMVDEWDDTDVWRTLTGAQIMYKDRFDVGVMIQTRERRRIRGDFTIRYVDQLAGRTYPDAVVFSASAYDSHGYPSSSVFALLPHNERSRTLNFPAPGGAAYTPYRAFLPQGVDGILVAGLGISMHRDASAMLRMQHDISNQGYAIGVAAAMAAAAGISPRAIDVAALQRHLIDTGALPVEVLGMRDTFPLSQACVEAAVNGFMDADDSFAAGKDLAVVMTHQEMAAPLLKELLKNAEPRKKLRAAMTLGVFGEPCAFDELRQALQGISCFDAPVRQGRMAEYAYLPTHVDGLLIALGSLADQRAVDAVTEKVRLLDAAAPLSHHRAAAFAVEHIGSPAFAGPVAELLSRKGMCGYALSTLFCEEHVMEKRGESLREISWARALFRCGDCDDTARKILQAYRHDLRGLYAAHAAAILSRPMEEGPPQETA